MLLAEGSVDQTNQRGLFSRTGGRLCLVNRGLASLAAAVFLGEVNGILAMLLWQPEYARFYTFDLLKQNRMNWGQLETCRLIILVDRDSSSVPLAALWLWQMRAITRRYLTCWVAWIFFRAPQPVRLFQGERTWNNLNLFEVWESWWFAIFNRDFKLAGTRDARLFPPWFLRLNSRLSGRGPILILAFLRFICCDQNPMRRLTMNSAGY